MVVYCVHIAVSVVLVVSDVCCELWLRTVCVFGPCALYLFVCLFKVVVYVYQFT